MASKRWKSIQHRVEFIILRGFLIIIWLVPLNTVLMIGDILGWFAFSVLRVRRRVALDNLAYAFPEKSREELEVIAKRAYQNFIKMTIEYMRFPLLDKEEVLSLCRLDCGKELDWIIQNGKGGVLVAGHFGNWELMGSAIAQTGYPISFLVGEQHNKRIDDMMNHHRELMGIHIIHMGVAVRGVIKALRSNGMVALLSDQDAGKDGVFVDFFGRKASTPQGPAVFALKTGAPILFGSAIRLPGGRHRVEGEVLRFDHLKEITPENIREVSQAYTTALEKSIRAHPDHWFWMHRRWKTRPPEENL